MDINKMTTEQRNEKTMHLDELSTEDFVALMNQEDQTVAQAIAKENTSIARVIDTVIEGFKQGGRLIYMGAGTSGRLGVLDAAECVPTFGVTRDDVIGLIAGGAKAMTEAVEGAEDSKTLGKQDLKHLKLNETDTVIGLAASGRTPYVIGGLEYANTIGANTAAIACNKNTAIGAVADIAIEIEVGPEILTGSTRLKSGTAQKLVLNMISTGAMVGIGKVYENLMVDVQPTNEKLRRRALNIISEVANTSESESKELFHDSNGHVKAAIVMGLHDITYEEAVERLEKANGFIRKT
ncbi:N-acetylmuramic acid 6-phosphate etherase [Staphylococcus simulans]|uniref:N-acetylmuramic acid 6-phosphate etherase n=1 Tax=Staphylococcus simulans TaxID=1286 RepID=UPI000D1EC585|nr:N-acetylmuramic acid 6-phosphate etherase [Staphylococcus simulans]MDQ7112701.1 N-acetylmuramic acid 6-phosphate etherase [Staphylococcus simulans]MDQ7116549.1 N-acetylmuramic acid 6-phosphate etherase [Staphylococcus simulans]PTI87958.1 N-acetylmuramic acid 6-phosphate etherase [Staphylococcus simulans]RIN53298.1 N-acetylmuramic acid 6-phosphate etherase [Staphylococcus simulans]UXR52823.1 N-acetylmuramic acid 6-phosphate etherase [Staphylococcus simulans]